jgi:hypothetical protein
MLLYNKRNEPQNNSTQKPWLNPNSSVNNEDVDISLEQDDSIKPDEVTQAVNNNDLAYHYKEMNKALQEVGDNYKDMREDLKDMSKDLKECWEKQEENNTLVVDGKKQNIKELMWQRIQAKDKAKEEGGCRIL